MILSQIKQKMKRDINTALRGVQVELWNCRTSSVAERVEVDSMKADIELCLVGPDRIIDTRKKVVEHG